ESRLRLLAQVQSGNELAVPFDVLALEVVEEPAPLTDQLEKTATRVVVLLVRLEVLRQLRDALGEKSDLNLGRPSVLLMLAELLDDGGLGFAVNHDSKGSLPDEAGVADARLWVTPDEELRATMASPPYRAGS